MTGEFHPTQDVVAKALGLSRSTVSLALRNDPRIKPKTRTRVGEFAAQLGYRPHIAARSLVLRRTQAIGFIMGGPHLSPFDFIGGYSVALRALSAGLRAQGYHLLLAGEVAESGGDSEILVDSPLLTTRMVDGLLVLHPPTDNLELSIRQLRLPYVVMDGPPQEGRCCIGRDEKATAVQAVERLVQLGHQRIALLDFSRTLSGVSLATRPIHPRWGLRVAGYLEAMARAGLVPLSTWEDRRPLPQRLESIVQTENKPTAFICYDSNDAASAALWLAQKGIRVPQEVSLIALHPYTGMHHGAFDLSQITTFESQHDRMGKLAAEKLIEYITKPRQKPSSVVLEPVLCAGSSVARPGGG